MFVAYCLNNVKIGEKIDNLTFTEAKDSFKKKLLFFNKSLKDENWFVLNNTKLLFHKSWLNCIIELDDTCDNGIVKIIDRARGIYIYRIFDRMQEDNNENLYYNDYETNEKCYNVVNYYTYETYQILFDSTDLDNGNIYIEICPECKELHNLLYKQHSFNFCNSCFKTKSKICEICGKQFFSYSYNNIILNDKKVQLCSDCLSTIQKCKLCGKKIIKKNGIQIEDDLYCKDCYPKIIKLDNTCICEICGHIFYKNSTQLYNTKNKKIICKVCHFNKRNRIDRSNIHNYTYKPEPIFFSKNKNDNLFFGVEIEIITPINREEISKYICFEVNEDEEFIYTKFDRSLGNEGLAGFEIVTHPFNYDWLISDEGKEIFKNIFKITKYKGEGYYTNTCGMHVHMSKNQFSSDHLYKFLSFIYNNESFSILISERFDIEKINNYSSFKSLIPLEKLAKIKTNPHDNDNRHRAINLSCLNTVELRIFRSTLEYDRFMKNMNFCKAVFNFTREISIMNNTVSNFKSFVINKRNEYPFLFNFLTSMGEL